MTPIPVASSPIRLVPDASRLLLRPFIPAGHIGSDERLRARSVLARIEALTDDEVATGLTATRERYAARHRGLDRELEQNYRTVVGLTGGGDRVTPERRLLIGAYFSHEYAIEAAALSNPSIVPAPDQSALQEGQLRFIMSLRAIGEGHLSSVEFRSGIIDAQGVVSIDEVSPHATSGKYSDPVYDKQAFRAKLLELGVLSEIADLMMDPLPVRFGVNDIEASIASLDQRGVSEAVAFETVRIVRWVAASNYLITFDDDTDVSERVLFPSGPTESQGMEDARFVRFQDDGSARYFATYTAFDGYQILPQLIETVDFITFRIATLNGPGAANKGMALFPRKIDGRYAALSRPDNESNHLVFSDDARSWDAAHVIQAPQQPWELVQLGNCGSPIETEAGWLVLTHGVGPMRRYSIGAILLDVEDPLRVIGSLDEPLLSPGDDDRDGYVPNVVYSCGGMVHGERLVIPYGYADTGATIATVMLDDLLAHLTER